MKRRYSSICSNYSQGTCSSIASFVSEWSTESIRIANCLSGLSNFTPDLQNCMNVKTITGSDLEKVHSGFFLDNSMWLCGAKWKKNVFWNIIVPSYSILRKFEHYDSNAELETIMFAFDKELLFAKKMGHEVYQLNKGKEKPDRVYNNPDISISAMCSSTDHVFILDHKRPKFIRVFDTNFQQVGTVDSYLKGTEIKECTLDMCVMKSPQTKEKMDALDYAIIISCSRPQSSVKVVSKTKGVLYQLDKSHSLVPDDFNPCSVCYSEEAGVLVADREADRVSQQNIQF